MDCFEVLHIFHFNLKKVKFIFKKSSHNKKNQVQFKNGQV